MKTKECPTPRVNAEHRAKLICVNSNDKSNQSDWEAEAIAAWIAATFPLASPLAPILAKLARLGGAIG